jgi:predicted DNA-binding transcriptional regulator YafY
MTEGIPMRRADRLFQIIQILRGARAPITATALASELEISLRTVYRDVADLMAQRVPIRGETGVGYVLEKSYDMPPLMLTPDEIEAAVLGAKWVVGRGDPVLARGARDLIAKITDVIPIDLRPVIVDSPLAAPHMHTIKPDAIDVAQLRAWIRRRGKVAIGYGNAKGEASQRIIWPITIAYFETIRVIAAWCEQRIAFRNFRTDRITAVEFLDDTYPERTADLRKRWWQYEQENLKKRGLEIKG